MAGLTNTPERWQHTTSRCQLPWRALLGSFVWNLVTLTLLNPARLISQIASVQLSPTRKNIYFLQGQPSAESQVQELSTFELGTAIMSMLKEYIPSKETVKARLTTVKAWELPKQGWNNETFPYQCIKLILSSQKVRSHLLTFGRMPTWTRCLENTKHGHYGPGWPIGPLTQST
jgi:hypothetical protein